MNRRAGGERAAGRELALLALCHLESYAPAEREQALEVFWDNPPGQGGEDVGEELARIHGWMADRRARGFGARLVRAYLDDARGVDDLIETCSKSWRIARMDRVDRNILRLVAVELRTVPKTPRAVVLAEAVRLAARYGSERSASFVNGLADTLARLLTRDEPTS